MKQLHKTFQPGLLVILIGFFLGILIIQATKTPALARRQKPSPGRHWRIEDPTDIDQKVISERQKAHAHWFSGTMDKINLRDVSASHDYQMTRIGDEMQNPNPNLKMSR
ncbi:MAG TPA: hypothetical protein VFC63_22705 [Blastocatellia bacterium]|nr:hypothetical protein [Blastocatellia bacterium]